MKQILEDFKTLIAEIIGLVGGLIWAANCNWDYEPIILIVISLVGIIIFIVVKFLPPENNIPKVVIELVYDGGWRGAQQILADKSPRDEDGFYIQKKDGIYYYEVEHKYNLVIRNNSTNNAYNLKLFKNKGFIL